MQNKNFWTKQNSMAYMPYPVAPVSSESKGALSGLTFTVKDMFDVAGYPTSAGNPTMLALSGIKTQSAEAVEKLLEAGAIFDGKVVTDELAFSVIGSNAHFGTPINGAAPDRFAGGSSSGSASSVSCGLCDFSLATDSGGSVRGPASQSGLYGIRPSFGRISLKGCLGLCPPFDTAGILARTYDVFEASCKILLGEDNQKFAESVKLMVPKDILEIFGEEVSQIFKPYLVRLEEKLGRSEKIKAYPRDPRAVLRAYQRLQAKAIWTHYGKFIEDYHPCLGPGVKERFAFAKSMADESLKEESAIQNEVRAHISRLLGDHGVLVLPTLPSESPKRDATEDELEAFRSKMSVSFCLGGLAGLPWITLPLMKMNGCPLGLSIVGPFGSDVWLLSLASQIVRHFQLNNSPYEGSLRENSVN